MRVMLIHNRYRSAAPSGENRVVDQESAMLRSRGHEVEHFECNSDDIDGWSMRRRITVGAQVVWNPSARRLLDGALRRFQPDVAHVHNTFPLLSPSVLYACRDARVPVVATMHNYKLLCASGDFFRNGEVCHDCALGNPMPGLVRGCYRGSTLATAPVVVSTLVNRGAWRRLVTAYIAISAAQKQLMEGLGLDPQRVFVKHNFVPLETMPQVSTGREVVYVGRLDQAKGVPLLLDAWDRYRAAAGDDALHLRIVGSGPLTDDVTRWAAGRRSVEVLGLVSRTRCLELIAAARATILPSQWEETFGLAAVESMAVGTPPVAAAHGSFPELITAGSDGELFRPGDAADLARVVTHIDTDADRYAAYGRRARSTYRRRFDPTGNVIELERIYTYAAAAGVHETLVARPDRLPG